MAFNSKKETAGPVDPDERLTQVMGVIVARVKELAALKAELLAAEDAVRAAGGLGASVPASYCGMLWLALEQTQRSWAAHRRDLDGSGPPPPSKLEVAISETRAALLDCDQKVAMYTEIAGRSGGKDAAILAILQSWAEVRVRHRRALAGLLAELRPQTKEVMAERMTLAEATAETSVLLRVA